MTLVRSIFEGSLAGRPIEKSSFTNTLGDDWGYGPDACISCTTRRLGFGAVEPSEYNVSNASVFIVD